MTKLYDRIATLLKADAHGVLESLEERSLLLKQYVRDAEIELNHKRARLEALQEEDKQLRDSAARHQDEMKSLDEDIALALAAGKDELARFAIRRIIPTRHELKLLQTRAEQRGTEARVLAGRLAEQEAQLEALRVRVRAQLALGDESSLPGLSCETVAEEEIEIELMRRRQVAGGKS